MAGRRPGRTDTGFNLRLRRRRPACSRGWQGGAEGLQVRPARREGRSVDSLSSVHNRREERIRESSRAVLRPSSRLLAKVIVMEVSILLVTVLVLILALFLGALGRKPPTRARYWAGQIIAVWGGKVRLLLVGEEERGGVEIVMDLPVE
jgi:hypothetical protein